MNITEVISTASTAGRDGLKSTAPVGVGEPETLFADLMSDEGAANPELNAEVDFGATEESIQLGSVELADRVAEKTDLLGAPFTLEPETPKVPKAVIDVESSKDQPHATELFPIQTAVGIPVESGSPLNVIPGAIQAEIGSQSSDATAQVVLSNSTRATIANSDITATGKQAAVIPEATSIAAAAIPKQDTTPVGEQTREAKLSDVPPNVERLGTNVPEVATPLPAQQYNGSGPGQNYTLETGIAPKAQHADMMLNLQTESSEAQLNLPLELRTQQTSPSTALASTQMSSPQKAIVHQIVASLSKPHDGSIRIRLDPPELGRITLQITPAEHGAIASVSAERPEVLDLIKRNADMLNTEMKNAGYQDLSFQFSQQGETEDDGTDRASKSVYVTKDDDTTVGLASQNAADLQQMRDDGSIDIRL